MADERPGHEGTPYLPGGEYRVHDPARPHPPAITPGGAVSREPPSDATVLFDGGGLDGWEAVDGGEPGWTVLDGTLVVDPDTDDIRTTERLGDCQLHVEWATPPEPEDSTYPGNSGIFLADRYELQILNNRDSSIYADGYAGAIYGQQPPLVDATFEPGSWESFDVIWRSPRFDGGDLEMPGRVTLHHNGVLVHDQATVFGPTSHREARDYEPHPVAQPLRLQAHGSPVRFRNIWYRPIDAQGDTSERQI